jgi:glycine/D-amino acid oxidase-like deaminating enzyme
MPSSRREFLALAATGLAGCSARRAAITPPSINRARLARVNVAPERVIRVIVGLRPYRPSGFVVRADKLDSKTIIHNYGHGGAGITLSWGTAHLAMEEAARIPTREAAVLGGGIVGLSTARLLQQRGSSVTIYTKAMPPDTTSNIGGGYWDPVTVYDHTRVTPEFKRQFGEAARFAFRYYQSLTSANYGVRWLPVYKFSRDGPYRHADPESPYSEVDPLFPDARQLPPEENPFDVPYVYRYSSMLIEPAIYLPALLRDYFSAGGRIVVREFAESRELLTLKEDLLFNCTGLGSRMLFNDEELVPVRGQLVFLLPQAEINYMTIGPSNIYMFPRQDGILLGGSHEMNDANLAPDAATTERILRENGALFRGMK